MVKKLNAWLAKDFGKIEFVSERNKRQFAWLALIAGLIIVAGGVFGIWMQGRTMYDDTPLHLVYDYLCLNEVYLSMCLAPLVTSIGVLILCWVILASKFTEKLSETKKNFLFVAFTIILSAAIMIASKIAADQDWARARAASEEYFQAKYGTNSPTIIPSHLRNKSSPTNFSK